MKYDNLRLKDFGPIKQAEINICPLTIFIGPNSSGKSFSTTLIHSLLNSFNNLGFSQYEDIRNKSVNLFLENDTKIFKEFKNELKDYVDSKPKISDEPFKFPFDKFKIILKESFGQVFKDITEEKLKDSFSNNLNDLNRLKKYPFEFSYNDNTFSNYNGELSLDSYYVNMDEVKDEGLLNEDKNICFFEIDENFLFIHLNYILWENFFNDKNELFSEIIFMMIVSSLMDTFDKTSYYLPAAGNELFKDINTFISNDIQGSLNHSLVQKELLINILKIEKDMNQSPFYQLTEELEQEILGGKIKFKKSDVKDEFVFFDEENNMEIDLSVASSSTRELIPIILHLKYFLKKGDTLILEEPENHLNPKNQLILVKYLVKAINLGLNIIIATHSDYIVEKFNNFIRLANANDEIYDQFGYCKSNALDYQKVGIYNFKKVDNYGYIVESLDINETGFDENSFYEVNTELYDESVDIIDAAQDD